MIPLLFFLSFINAQIALPTFQSVHKIHATVLEFGTQTFSYTGSQQTFTVPSGVTEIQFDVMGAEGGDIDGITVGWGGTSNVSIDAGNGGRVTGILPVTAGETLYIYVGGEGSEDSGGYNGGGDAETCSGTEVIAAGGGGGSSYTDSGATDVVHTQGAREGNGLVVIAW